MKTVRKPSTSKQTSSHQQRQFLLRELRGTSFWKVPTPKLPKTAKVRAAEKAAARANRVINAHANAERRLRDKKRDRYNKLEAQAKRAIYFESPKKALAAVDRLLKFCEGKP